MAKGWQTKPVRAESDAEAVRSAALQAQAVSHEALDLKR